MSAAAISEIQPLWNAFPTGIKGVQSGTGEKGDAGSFFSVFQDAIDAVKTTDAEKNKEEYRLATGNLDNPADLTIASTKAELSVDLLVQLRNKALDAYSELMRISF